MIGDGAKAMIRKGLSQHGAKIVPDEVEKELWPIFLAYYEANITRRSQPFEHCVNTLDALRGAGANLTVCTVIGGDTLGLKKPNGRHIIETVRKGRGAPARAIMIGDAWTDERAARDAGLPFVFVSFGYGSLSDEPYDCLRSIDHWRDMQQALTELARQT